MEKFREYLAEFGANPSEVTLDGKFHRIDDVSKKNGNKNVWYVGEILNDHIYATVGNWGTGQQEKYTNGGSKTDPAVLNIFKIQAKAREREQRKVWAEKATIAKVYCDSLEPASKHPYLDNKQILPCGALQDGDKLVIPLMTADGDITTYQTIMPDGTKRFLPGGKKKGSCFPIAGNGEKVYVVEGYATGATIAQATGNAVLVAFDTGNLKPVVKNAKKIYSNIIIAADNDHQTEGNPGITKAKEAHDNVIWPEEIEGTDFNDMACEQGIETVRILLTKTIKKTYQSKTLHEIMNTKYEPIRWAVKDIIPEGLTILAGKPKMGKSWLLLGLAYAVATGTKAWGYKETEKGSVHYLALEDSERRLQDRCLSMEGYVEEFVKNMHMHTKFPKLGDGCIDAMQEIVENDPKVKVIIVDTLQKIRPNSTGKRNLYQAEYEDYGRLQRFAIENGIAVICVHHTRKGSNKYGGQSNPIDEMSGSTGIQGVADTLIVCTREGSKGVMHVTGREVNEEDYQMYFNKKNMTWELSDPENMQIDMGNMMLTEWFKNNNEITVDQAVEVFDVNIRTAQRKLKNLVKDGKLVILRSDGPRKKVYGLEEIF